MEFTCAQSVNALSGARDRLHWFMMKLDREQSIVRVHEIRIEALKSKIEEYRSQLVTATSVAGKETPDPSEGA